LNSEYVSERKPLETALRLLAMTRWTSCHSLRSTTAACSPALDHEEHTREFQNLRCAQCGRFRADGVPERVVCGYIA